MSKNKAADLLQVEFICPHCNEHLAWALPSAQINCPVCGTWVNNENRKKVLEIYLPVDSEQMVLFK